MSTSFKSLVTDIEYLSKTRQVYQNELSFAGRGLKLNTKDDVKEICDEILKKDALQVLRLEGNTISPEAAEELGKALVKHPEFERFIGNDIFTGRLKDEIPLSLKSICGAFEASGSKLVEINLSDNAFGPIGLDALVNFFQSGCCFSLKEIRMHNNGLGPQGAQKFAYALDKCYENSNRKLALKVFICGRNRLEYEGSKAISNTLKNIGTLEEIQMPQNGIRPNGIEFLAEACANNTRLRIINFNDNTFRKIGAEWMAKALDKLNNLEYINFGDCLIRSSGSVLIARALVKSQNLKEVILSFNEISLTAGLEIASLLLKNKDTLKSIDLNGNKFGEEGKIEIQNILQPMSQALASLSEDEGSDEEEGEEDEDHYEEESEEEEEEDDEHIEVGDDYDQVDDEYDEDYDEGEDEEYDEEEDYDGEEGEEVVEEKKYGNFDIVQPQQSSIFSNFKAAKQPSGGNNLFTTMVNNNYLLTTIQQFDTFILNPNLENLKLINESTLENVKLHQKFNGPFLIRFLAHLSKVYDSSNTDDSKLVLNIANNLVEHYLRKLSNANAFGDEILTEFGFLKSEEKNFRPVDLTKNLNSFLVDISKQNYFPSNVKSYIINYLSLRNQSMTKAATNSTFKDRSEMFIKCFS